MKLFCPRTRAVFLIVSLLSGSAACASSNPAPVSMIAAIEANDGSEVPTLEDVESRLINGDPLAAWMGECINSLTGINFIPAQSPTGGWTMPPVGLPEEFSPDVDMAAAEKCETLLEERGYAPPAPTEAELQASYREALDAVACYEERGVPVTFDISLQDYLARGLHEDPIPVMGSADRSVIDAAIVACVGSSQLIYGDSGQ